MDRIKLTVSERKLVGKKVRRLRKEGIIPANVFGKDIKSESIQVEAKEFQKILKEAGETALVDVKVGDKVFTTLIHNVQREPRVDSVLHVDFHKVNLKEKITAHVPVVLEGESPVVKSGEGLVLQILNEVEIECLPTDIPSQIEVDATKLTEIGQNVHIKDLKVEKDKIEVKNDPEEVIASVQTAEMKEEEPEPEVSPADVEATAEKGDAEEGEGGEDAAEKPAEVGKDENPKE